MDERIQNALQRLSEFVRGTPFEGRLYAVGGVVRDDLLGRPGSTDADIASEIPLEPLLDILRTAGDGGRAPEVYPRFGTAMVRVGGVSLEFAVMRRESYDPESRKPSVAPASMDEDAARRDFTVNALYRPLTGGGGIIDPTGKGIADLKAKILRNPGDPGLTFIDDPLRMFRAVRFRHKLGFEFAPGLADAIRENRARAGILSMERVRDEVLQMLDLPSAAAALADLMDLGLFDDIAPELVAMKGVAQGKYHHLDVWRHSLLVVDQLWPAWREHPALDSPDREKGQPSRLDLLAGLLHDVAKPPTKSQERGEIHFFHHESVGAQMAEAILLRWKLSTAEAEKVAHLVRNHMRLQQIGEFSDAAVRRLIRDMGDDLPSLLNLVEADVRSLRPGVRVMAMADVRARIAAVMAATPANVLESPLDGGEIMSLLGLEPGPQVGRWKQHLLDRVLDGRLAPGDKDTARAELKSAYEDARSSADDRSRRS